MAVDQRLDETLRYGLKDFRVGRYVADGPLAKLRAAQSEQITARLGDVLLQTFVHFVVGAEGAVTRVFGH